MDKKTKILQVGEKNWVEQADFSHRADLEWYFLDVESADENIIQSLRRQMKNRTFEVVLGTDRLDNQLLDILSPLIESYALVLDNSFETEVSDSISQMKCPVFMSLENKDEVLNIFDRYFFPGQMGAKLHVHNCMVSASFEGEHTLLGEHRLRLSGDFSNFEHDCPVLTWQYNIFMFGRTKKLWLEFEHSETINLTMIITGIRQGTSQVMGHWQFNEKELRQGFEIPYEQGLGYLNISLVVEGKGELQVGPLHYRDSRSHYGEYILGGQKISDDQNEELYYYFHPGDLKPPLNVYFSGYRPAEGFEGFYMMKKMGTPFLLITDPRLEGGSFYLGSERLEEALQDVIKTYLDKLGFSQQELILSGLSMGTFGALYYGSYLEPHSIILGKPLANLGTMAEMERIIRPGGFPTSLDLLQSLTGRQDKEGIEALNQRFWSVFDSARFKNTQFAIAYMKDDDYDGQAYGDILEHLMEKETHIIGKGIAGRHNDNSGTIVQWFINHYKRILVENFHRGEQI